MQAVYWLIIFVVLLLIEIFTMGLTTIWFAGGALGAFLAGVLGAGTGIQLVVFIVLSALLLLITRPLAVRHLNHNQNGLKTNTERLIGKHALVVEDINTLQALGSVEVNGQIWSAKTASPGGRISKDTVVVIDDIQGVRLIVREKEEEKEC